MQPYDYAGYTPKGDRPASPAPSAYSSVAASYSAPAAVSPRSEQNMTNSPAKKWQPYGYGGYTPKGDRPRAAAPAPSSYSAPAASKSAPAQSSSTIGYYWLQYVTCNWLLAMVLQWLAYNGSTIRYLQLVTYNWILTMVHNWSSQWGYGGYTRKGREVTKSDLSNAFSHAQTSRAVLRMRLRESLSSRGFASASTKPATRAAVQPWLSFKGGGTTMVVTIILLVAEISLSTCQSSNCVSEKYQLTQGSGSVQLARCQSGGCCRLEGSDTGSSGSRFASVESITATQFDDDVRNFTRNYTDPGATFLISLAGAKSSTEITIKFEGAIRQPLFPGPYRHRYATERKRSVCVTSVLISDNSEMEMALIQGDFEPGQMKSVLVTPENNSFRYGASIDIKEDNYLDVIFEISVPFLPNAGIFLGFPTSYERSQIGCQDGSCSCINAASCISGCDGTLNFQPSSLISSEYDHVYRKPTARNAADKIFDLAIARNGDGSDDVGTVIAIRLFNFSVPSVPKLTSSASVDMDSALPSNRPCAEPLQCGTLGIEKSFWMCCRCGGGYKNDKFVVGTLTDGYLTEWRDAKDFDKSPCIFQAVSQNSCGEKLKSPEKALDNQEAGLPSAFSEILLRTTDEIAPRDLIHVDFYKRDMSARDLVPGQPCPAGCALENFPVRFSTCSARGSCDAKTIVTFNFSSLVSSEYNRITVECPRTVSADTIVKLSNVGKTFSADENKQPKSRYELKNKAVAGRLGTIRIQTQTSSCLVVVHSQAFEPAFCKHGISTWINFGPVVGDPMVNLKMSKTCYVCVYLPKYFEVSTNDSLPPAEKKQSFPRTTVQSRAEIPTFTKQTIPIWPIFDPPISGAWASIVTAWCWICWRVWAVNIGGQVSGRWRRRGSIIFCLVRLLSASSALLASLPAAGKRRSKFKCVPTATSAAARLTALLMLVGMLSLASAQVFPLSCNAGYFGEITNAVEYNGRVYRTLDGTSPLDTGSSKCQNYWLALPSGWSLAADDADSLYVISSYRWGTYGLLVANGYAYVTSSGSYCCSGYLYTSGSTYKAGCNLLILISKAGSACTACPAGESEIAGRECGARMCV